MLYSGVADWDTIAKVRQQLSIPVIANGDIVDGPSAMRCLKRTGADGIMIEVHNNPSCALCDGAQSLTPEQFAEVAQKVKEFAILL